jgi:hypothetical protein
VAALRDTAFALFAAIWGKVSPGYAAALGLIPYSHNQRAKNPSICTPHAQAMLLNIDSAIVFHHSSSAPTS